MNEKEAEKIGLCATCRHCRAIASDRHAVFYQCQLARSDPSYALYPRLPVLRCNGYEEAARAIGKP